MGEYVKNMEKYVRNMKKYVENKKKYVALGLRRAKGESSSIPFSLYKSLGTWKNSEHSHIDSGTQKNSELYPLYMLWDWEERSTSRHIYLSPCMKVLYKYSFWD